MKTKIVYVLTSSKEDTYLEQTLISVYSARLHNPYADILVVTDNATANTIKGGRAEIKKYLSDIVVVDIPAEYNNMQKSRYIKTNLRKFVEGDFLYIDSDTVIAESLAEICFLSNRKPCTVKSSSIVVNALNIVVNRHIKRCAAQHIKNELSLSLSLGCIYSLSVEINSDLQACCLCAFTL